MGRYEVGVVGADPPAGGGPMSALRAAASQQVSLLEVWAVCVGGVGAGVEINLVRSTALGTATASVLGEAEDPSEGASVTNVDTAWSVNPTLAAVPLRKSPGGTATAGQGGWKWEWPEEEGLIVPVSASVVIAAVGNPGQFEITWVWWE